jgi:hypothetical protein
MSEADRILNALRAAGQTGLLIKELETRLNMDSQMVSDIAQRLLLEGQIMQKHEMETRRLFIRKGMTDETQRGNLSDLNGCPCFHCLKITRCGVRQPDSPVTCRDLDQWMLGSEAT